MAKGQKTGGRKKGTPNKFSGQIKDMIARALDQAGGVKYLKKQATENPTAFLSLVGRLVPHELVGKDGERLFDKVERVIVREKK